MMISKDEYSELQQYEGDLRRAYKGKYKLPTRKEEDDKIIGILLKYEPKFHVNRGCGNCMFKVYERVGSWYYAYQETENTSVFKLEIKKDEETLRTERVPRKRNSRRLQD